MKILIVGATGIIGGAVADLLSKKHEVVRIGNRGGDLQVDADSLDSINALYARTGRFDALISAIGGAVMGPLTKLNAEDYAFAFNNKVMAQINLVRLGLPYVNDNGSFTLSSGFLNKEPMPTFSSVTMANGAIDGFVKGAALDMPRGIRINCVSPLFVVETLQAAGMTNMSGFATMIAADTALAYRAALEGASNGMDLDPRNFI
jgi:NAD(P)-dependent dehydrogenase (short-subunit alcohol dehydrogenase family)